MNEKNYVPLLYLGLCENPNCSSPYHIESLHAVIDPSELPERCQCGAKIRWEAAVNRHDVQSLKKKRHRRKTAIIALTITLLALAGSAAFFYALRHKTYTVDQMSAAQGQLAGKTVSEVLTQLHKDTSDAAIGHLLNASPFTIERLRKNETQPTPAMAAQVYGLACQWHLNHNSWLLTRLQLYHKTDLFYTFPDTTREVPN